MQFTAPAQDLKIANRELGTVASIGEDGRLSLRMDGGREVELDPPKHLLRQDVERHKRFDGEIQLDDSDVLLLAKKYKVSEAAMRYRLQNLSFMSWA